MSRLTRMFNVRRKSLGGSVSGPDEGLVSDSADRETDSSRGSVGDYPKWGDWSQGHDSDGELQYLSMLNDHEDAGGGLISVKSGSSGSKKRQSRATKSLPDIGGLVRPRKPASDKRKVLKKKEERPKEKEKPRRKSEALEALDFSKSPGDNVRGDDSESNLSKPSSVRSDATDSDTLRIVKKSKKKVKGSDDMTKSSRKSTRKKEKRRSDAASVVSKKSTKSTRTSKTTRSPRSRTQKLDSDKIRSRSLDGKDRKRSKSSSSARSSKSKTRSDKVSASPRHRERDSPRKAKRSTKMMMASELASGTAIMDILESEMINNGETSIPQQNDDLDMALMPPSVPSLEDTLAAGDESQRNEILRLHQMLSDALQKVATQSAEQIQDKDMLMKVSSELSKLKSDFDGVQRERNRLKLELEERDSHIEKCVGQIDTLTQSLEKQRADQALVEADLEQSEADVDKLLIKIEDLERAVDSSGNVTDETLREELKEAKMSLVDRNREVENQKSRIEQLETELENQKVRIEHLEQDLEETTTVHNLQIEELESDKQALEGKLKGERLDMSTKVTEQEERIEALELELSRYKGNNEYEDIAIVREDLQNAQKESKNAVQEMEAAQGRLSKVVAEKDDLLERNNKLNAEVKRLEKLVRDLNAKADDLGDKVLKWTEQTYDWKSRAEAAEKKLSAVSDENDIVSDSGSTVDEAPQGLFLQAVMDKQQESTKKVSRGWNLFSRNNGQATGEEQSAEEIRIKGLEEQNQGLLETNSSLQSDLVKLQTTHKEEMYNKQKYIEQLETENEALKLKNQALSVVQDGTEQIESSPVGSEDIDSS
eukprot:CAMPEP_0176018560 /NCGR_PEP_ID=MMETSP0120_2-20121206/8940_1 /TAXON_ID=160619 /ORGANISM="Kryptoperidinium foliaceum, Strain CCMP 1326" /LENGTH=824 /DNA_ID=CAMNT_0017351613 /DNA_START=62 /DNA_END=2536 /DNA_ORIENTATION=-